jgi:hypothetical protein
METQAAIERFLASPALSDSTRRAYGVDLAEFGACCGRGKASVETTSMPACSRITPPSLSGAPGPRAEQTRAGDHRTEARGRPGLPPPLPIRA